MPTYDYHCVANNQVVEVRHSMSETLTTWGEVCAKAGVDMGTVPANTPVSRLISGGQFIRSQALRNPEPSCASGSCCPSGMCGLN